MMTRRVMTFDTIEELEEQFHEIVESGVSKDNITLYSPNPNHHFDHLMDDGKPSWVRAFVLFGGLLGFFGALFMTVYMSAYSWPLNTGGKPYASYPPFMVIMFELTVLLGCVIGFLGFLTLARLPNPLRIIAPEEYSGSQFTMVIDESNKEVQ